MAIRQNVSGDSYELFLKGRIDGTAAHEMEVQILAAIKAGAKEIFINMAEADFLCSAGIRVLLQHWRQLKSQGRLLKVTHPSTAIAEILQMTGFQESIVDNPSPQPR